MQKAIGYIRVSTQGQADEGVSLEAQRAKIEAYCSLNDMELVAVFEDAGISGASMTGRSGLSAALKATGKNMTLIAYSISRLARSTKDLLEIAETIKSKKAGLVSLTEKIDTGSAMGEFFFTVMGAIATLESKVTGERTKMALAHKKATGEVYAPTPFGFEAIEGKLVEVKREAQIVRDILSQREAGASLADIATNLNTQGITGKRGGKWFASTVKYLIDRQTA
jgi:DNA invertase Pin-like site-specific DNA recombinase